jgi:hypothetical protein
MCYILGWVCYNESMGKFLDWGFKVSGIIFVLIYGLLVELSVVQSGYADSSRPEWYFDGMSDDEVRASVTDEVVNEALSSNVETNVIGGGSVSDGFGSGVISLIGIALFVLTVGVVIAGIVGVLISAFVLVSAGNNEENVIKARRRILGIVVGLITWSVFYGALHWLIPGLNEGGELVSDEVRQDIFNAKKEAIIKERLAYVEENSGEKIDEENGLTFEQAKTLAQWYGYNKDGSSQKAVGLDWQWTYHNTEISDTSRYSCDVDSGQVCGGANCVTFSVFFVNKFTPIKYTANWGDTDGMVDALVNNGLSVSRTGKEPKVWAVNQGRLHTYVIVGHHEGKWIIVNAGDSNNGLGRGDGVKECHSGRFPTAGCGAAWATQFDDKISPDKWAASWNLNLTHYGPMKYAYVDVDTKKLGEYLKNGV